MNTTKTLTETLKQAGLRITPQLVAICRLLAESDTHPTAAMLYDQVREQFPSVSLATIYNTLDALVGLGMVNVLGPAGDGRVHFDADIEPHINLACTVCHKIIDLPSDQIAHLQTEVRQASGYELRGARIMYYGVCPDCQLTVIPN